MAGEVLANVIKGRGSGVSRRQSIIMPISSATLDDENAIALEMEEAPPGADTPVDGG